MWWIVRVLDVLLAPLWFVHWAVCRLTAKQCPRCGERWHTTLCGEWGGEDWECIRCGYWWHIPNIPR